MSRFSPPTDDTDTTFRTEIDTQVSTLLLYYFNGTAARMFATTTTTVTEFRGLSRQQALAMASNSGYNYRDMHGVKFTSGTAWQSMPDCEGTECKATVRRINEADMFRVLVTHVSTTVTHSGDWTKSTF